MKSFIKSSIGKKILMSASAIFLMIFLLQHFIINFSSIINPNLFNSLSHFMGTNLLVQFFFQPILILGVFFHFTLGFLLEYENRKSAEHQYSLFMDKDTSTWTSRNMVWSGLVILAFLILHLYDFWIPEISQKYIYGLPENPNRYYKELVHKFDDPLRVCLYCISFLFLSLHLSHGFSSSLKSLGLKKQYINSFSILNHFISIIIPFGFAFIAIYHYLIT